MLAAFLSSNIWKSTNLVCLKLQYRFQELSLPEIKKQEIKHVFHLPR